MKLKTTPRILFAASDAIALALNPVTFDGGGRHSSQRGAAATSTSWRPFSPKNRSAAALLIILAAIMLTPSCQSPQLGKFQDAGKSIREKYDVSLGVVPVPGIRGNAISWVGPFIVTPKDAAPEAVEDSLK